MLAVEKYDLVVKNFKKYLDENTDLKVEFYLDRFPMEVSLYFYARQTSMFDADPVVNKDGEVGCITVSYADTMTVRNTSGMKIDAKSLKKIISLVEKVCRAYLLALKEKIEKYRAEEKPSEYVEEIISELNARAESEAEE